MKKGRRTLARKLWSGSSNALSVCGLSAIVQNTVDLGNLAINVLARYVWVSNWIISHIQQVLSFGISVSVFHFFALGAPFWAPMYFGMRKWMRSIPLSGLFRLAWQLLLAPTSMIAAALLQAALQEKEAALGLLVKRIDANENRPKVRAAWRRLRREDFRSWWWLVVRATAVRALLLAMLITIGVFVAFLPIVYTILWPYFLGQALYVRYRYTNHRQRLRFFNGHGKYRKYYLRLHYNALASFSLVLLLFILFASVSVGIERLGGASVILDELKTRLMDAIGGRIQ